MGKRNGNLKGRLLATTIIASMIGAPAFAQEGPAEPQVRQVATHYDGIGPVLVIDGDESRERGLVRAEDLLNSLPQVNAIQGGYISNGATGTATLDLRALGPQRTLALLNGRRIAPGDHLFLTADLNVIPSLMLERIELTTGAAAATFGADAAAGAVNFVLDTDFEGFRFDAQAGIYQHNNDGDGGLTDAYNRRGWAFPQGSTTDGATYNVNFAYGTSFDNDRGHLAVYAGYRQVEAVKWDARDFSACATQARTPAQVTLDPTRLVDCGGSASSENGTVFIYDGGTSATFQIGPNRTLITGTTPYNFAPTNHLQRPDERYTAGLFASYEVSPVFRPYVEIMFMDDKTQADIAPAGNFGNTFTVNCGAPGTPTAVTPGIGNPLLSAQQRALICDTENLVTTSSTSTFPTTVGRVGGPPATFIDPTTGLPYTRGFAQILRRNVEGGAREAHIQHTNYRAVAGSRGDLGNSWSYDAYLQYSRTEVDRTYLNDMSVTRLTRAIDIIDDPRTPGVDPICRSALNNTDAACVPWDIFATGQVTDAALAYLMPPGLETAELDQTVLHASVTGNLSPWGVQSPWSRKNAFATFGAEYRADSLDRQSDALLSMLPSSDFSGRGEPVLPYSGDTDVREIFAELDMPLIEDLVARELTLQAGYRYSDHDTSGGVSTYHIGLNAVPIGGVWARAGYSRSAIAPNVQELAYPQRVALNGNGDPCAGAFPSAPLAACQAMGVTNAQYGNIPSNPDGQYNGLIGGNPDLEPEIADTFTVGVTMKPDFVPNLTVSVDYFDISVEDAITGLGQDAILSTCVDTRDPFVCGLVERDASGSIWQTQQGYVRDILQNRGGLKTSGIDVGANYAMALGQLGNVDINLQGTMLDKLEVDNGLSASWDCAGYYGPYCDTPKPEWRHRVKVTYAMPIGWDALLQWRYFGGVDIANKNPSPALNAPYAPFNERIASQSYIDLSVSTRLADAYTFRFGINNILDRSPPVVGTNGANLIINGCAGSQNTVFPTCNANTFPNQYDAMGRYIFAGVTVDF